MENNIQIHLTNVEYLRYIHLLELGVNFKLLSEGYGMSELFCIKFHTEDYQYFTMVEFQENKMKEHQMEVFDEPNL